MAWSLLAAIGSAILHMPSVACRYKTASYVLRGKADWQAVRCLCSFRQCPVGRRQGACGIQASGNGSTISQLGGSEAKVQEARVLRGPHVDTALEGGVEDALVSSATERSTEV